MFKTAQWYNSPNLALFLTNPLDEVTRKERSSLLLAATIGIFIAHLGLVPNQISVLGISFAPQNKIAWWAILATIVAYHLVAFSLYWTTDYIKWRRDARADLFRNEYQSLMPKDPAKPVPPLGLNVAVLEKVCHQ